MLGARKLILDTFCEVYDLLLPWSDGEFWDTTKHTIVPDAIYMVGRAQFNHNKEYWKDLVRRNQIRLILSNPAEGSETLKSHCEHVHQCADLVKQKRMLLVGGGDMDPEWPCLSYDSFLPKILDYEENLHEINRMALPTDTRPYAFLFLNGRLRSHRKYMLEKFDLLGLLDRSIWSCLESRANAPQSRYQVLHQGVDMMTQARSAKLLDPYYEVNRYLGNINRQFNNAFVKYELFGDEWGEIYLKAEPYQHTYFSVVTETVFEYPYSFRTEKIWKPIAMGHPFVVAANQGYLRDLRQLGFQTFDGIIDESYDHISDNSERLHRIVNTVRDLCHMNLAQFAQSCYNICRHNQQHLAVMRQKVRQEFPSRFQQFIHEHGFDE